jgi:cephalosporin-C deacetylase-like acetyl esterase
VVVSIDARFHGKRKSPERPLSSIMDDLHFFGDKVYYEVMIKDMVLDHQILLDWIEQQDNLNNNQITAAGYSMGGQISLILASIDKRIKKVISIVPPIIDDKTALVVPKNFISLLKDQQVLFVTADDDENAMEKENDYIYHLIPTSGKERIQFAGGHILPENYVDSLIGKFAS